MSGPADRRQLSAAHGTRCHGLLIDQADVAQTVVWIFHRAESQHAGISAVALPGTAPHAPHLGAHMSLNWVPSRVPYRSAAGRRACRSIRAARRTSRGLRPRRRRRSGRDSPCRPRSRRPPRQRPGRGAPRCPRRLAGVHTGSIFAHRSATLIPCGVCGLLSTTSSCTSRRSRTCAGRGALPRRRRNRRSGPCRWSASVGRASSVSGNRTGRTGRTGLTGLGYVVVVGAADSSPCTPPAWRTSRTPAFRTPI